MINKAKDNNNMFTMKTNRTSQQLTIKIHPIKSKHINTNQKTPQHTGD